MSNRNATASWSGYSHQGQVGILVALKEMRRLILIGARNRFETHNLVFEKFEDFAICDLQPHTAPNLISVHQVKAHYSNGHLRNSYKEVFTGKPIYRRDANDKIERDRDGNKIPTGAFAPGQWSLNGSNYLHTAVNIDNWSNDFADLGGNPYNISRFEYDRNIFYCGTDDISNRILVELNSPDFHNGNVALSNMALHRLCFALDEKIRNEHANKDGRVNYEIKFSFNELLEIIISEEDISNSEIHLSRKLFYERFIEVIKNEELELAEDHIEEIRERIIQKVYELDNANFLDFLKRLNPNIKPELLNTPHYNFNPDGFNQVFFDVLLQVTKNIPSIDENSIKYKKENNPGTYLLTTIMSDENEKKTIVQNIICNLKSQNILWENHAIINRNINGKFIDLNPKITEILEDVEKDLEYKKFMSFTQETKLINRDNAKRELND